MLIPTSHSQQRLKTKHQDIWHIRIINTSVAGALMIEGEFSVNNYLGSMENAK
jgi:hypothetical protein